MDEMRVRPMTELSILLCSSKSLVAGTLRRRVLLPDAFYPGFATLCM
jgi:hypothetical protein